MHQEQERSDGTRQELESVDAAPTWEEIYQVLRDRGWLPEFGARLPDDNDD